jgi:hypothetical protein
MKSLFGIMASIFMFAAPAQAITVNFDDTMFLSQMHVFELDSGVNTFSGNISGGVDSNGNTLNPYTNGDSGGYGFQFVVKKGFQLIDVLLGHQSTSGGFWANVDADLFKLSGPTPSNGSNLLHFGGARFNGSLGLDPAFYPHGKYQLGVGYYDLRIDTYATAKVSAVIHVSPIPLPASVWLLLTAFVGLFGFRSIGRLRVGHTA